MTAGFSRFNLDVEVFLRDYWQKQPLLIRAAVDNFEAPLSANELAGLAMEPAVESRIITLENDQWSLATGPFNEEDFQRDGLWTLLVQAVDHYVPEVAQLRNCVDFIPSWRFDDVMVSYAVDGGSVGPHFDRYDVFLLQGEGFREWSVGPLCDESTPRIDHDELHLLQEFAATDTYLLGPGDALYIPPGYAHWGVAKGECTTFSLGFRAPTLADLTASLADATIEKLNPHLLLEDLKSLGTENIAQGEITDGQLANARAAVINAINALNDGDWLGMLVSEPKYDDQTEIDDPMPDAPLMLDPSARVVWHQQSHQVRVYANGAATLISQFEKPLLITLCESQLVDPGSCSVEGIALLHFLWRANALMEEYEEDFDEFDD